MTMVSRATQLLCAIGIAWAAAGCGVPDDPTSTARSSAPRTASSAPAGDTERWREFRETWGLRTDGPWLAAVGSDPENLRNEFDVPLTPQEMQQIGVIVESGRSLIAVLRTYGDANPDDFAGVIMDGPTAVILFASGVEGHRDALARLMPAGAPWAVRNAPLTKEELLAAAAAVEAEAMAWLPPSVQVAGVNVGATGIRLRYFASDSTPTAAILDHFGTPPWLEVEWEGPPPWDGPRGDLRAVVTDADGKPVQDAQCEPVPIDRQVSAELGSAFVTNEHGVCRIRNLPAVAYELRIILEGHPQDDPAATAKVLLVGDETVTVRIQLSR